MQMAPVRPRRSNCCPVRTLAGAIGALRSAAEPRSRCAAPDDLLSVAGHLRPGLDGATRSPSWDSGCGPVVTAQPHHPLAAMMILRRLVTNRVKLRPGRTHVPAVGYLQWCPRCSRCNSRRCLLVLVHSVAGPASSAESIPSSLVSSRRCLVATGQGQTAPVEAGG